MVILLLVVEMGFRSQMHLQFGTWMHVQKQPGTAQPCAVILVHLLLCRMGQAPSWALLVSRCLELQELSSLGLLSVP